MLVPRIYVILDVRVCCCISGFYIWKEQQYAPILHAVFSCRLMSSRHLKQLQPVQLCTEHCAASTCGCCSWCVTIHILKSQFLLVYFLSITNKMQHYTIFFITVNALHVSGGFSARNQELKNCTHSIRCMSSLLATYTGCCVYSFWAPDYGRRNRPKHVEHWQ